MTERSYQSIPGMKISLGYEVILKLLSRENVRKNRLLEKLQRPVLLFIVYLRIYGTYDKAIRHNKLRKLNSG